MSKNLGNFLKIKKYIRNGRRPFWPCKHMPQSLFSTICKFQILVKSSLNFIALFLKPYDSRSNVLKMDLQYHIQLIWCGLVSRAFWHHFYQNRPKIQEVPAKNLFGARGGAKNWNFFETPLSDTGYAYFHDWGILTDVKLAQQPNFKSLKEIRPTVFVKSDFLGQNCEWGRFSD